MHHPHFSAHLKVALVITFAGTTTTFVVGQSSAQVWRISTVDTSGGLPSLAFGPDGQPAIAYYDIWQVRPTFGNLRFARFDGTSWNGVTVETHAPYQDAGRNPSLTFGPDGYPAIAFESQSLELRIARFDGSDWRADMVESLSYWDFYQFSPSLAFGPDGRPALSYLDVTNLDLIFARYSGTTWTRITIDAAGTNDFSHSFAFGPDGQPVVAYVRSSFSGAGETTSLRFARFDGVTWRVDTVESGALYGISLAFGPDGQPAIAFSMDGAQRFARFDGSAWNISAIDSRGRRLSRLWTGWFPGHRVWQRTWVVLCAL